jgi:hypothetical protein
VKEYAPVGSVVAYLHVFTFRLIPPTALGQICTAAPAIGAPPLVLSRTVPLTVPVGIPVPAPMSETVCGLLGALSVSEKVAARDPSIVGVRWSMTAHVAVGAIVRRLQLSAVMA